MTDMRSLLRWLLVFLALNLYANLLPRLVALPPLVWMGYAVGFFGLALVLGRWCLGVRNLGGFGLGMGAGWARQLGVGFTLGAAVWALKNVALHGMGKFDVIGLAEPSFVAMLMAKALVGMVLASAINDLMIRGYWHAWCQRTGRTGWFVVLATALYALDDTWNGGFTPLDVLFSLVLGIALAWTVLKTGRIWMSIGIHWGGNVVFRAMSGFDGRGAIEITAIKEGTEYELTAIAITALLIPAVYWLLRDRASVVAAPTTQA